MEVDYGKGREGGCHGGNEEVIQNPLVRQYSKSLSKANTSLNTRSSAITTTDPS